MILCHFLGFKSQRSYFLGCQNQMALLTSFLPLSASTPQILRIVSHWLWSSRLGCFKKKVLYRSESLAFCYWRTLLTLFSSFIVLKKPVGAGVASPLLNCLSQSGGPGTQGTRRDPGYSRMGLGFCTRFLAGFWLAGESSLVWLRAIFRALGNFPWRASCWSGRTGSSIPGLGLICLHRE